MSLKIVLVLLFLKIEGKVLGQNNDSTVILKSFNNSCREFIEPEECGIRGPSYKSLYFLFNYKEFLDLKKKIIIDHCIDSFHLFEIDSISQINLIEINSLQLDVINKNEISFFVNNNFLFTFLNTKSSQNTILYSDFKPIINDYQFYAEWLKNNLKVNHFVSKNKEIRQVYVYRFNDNVSIYYIFNDNTITIQTNDDCLKDIFKFEVESVVEEEVEEE